MGIRKQNYLAQNFWELALFFLWPFMSFIFTLKNLGNRISQTIIIFFFGLFGYTFIYGESADSSRHADNFISLVERPFSDFFNIITGLYSAEGQKPDFFFDFIGFIVSRFTDNTHFFFMILSFILGGALVKNIKMFNDVYIKNKNSISLIFILFFFFLIPPVRLLSFRHYLALLVFVYGMYSYFKERKIIYLIILTLSIFIHFGFLLVIGIFYIYKLLGNRNLIYYILIILSFVFNDLSATFLRQIGTGFSLGGLDQIVSGYTNEEYLIRVSEIQDQRYVILNEYIYWTSLFFLFSMIYHKFKHHKFDKVSENIYSFILLFFAFLNFSIELESVANRFGVAFQIIGCVFYIHVYAINKIKSGILFNSTSILFLLVNFTILMRITIEYANLLMITPFLPLAFLVDSDVTILNLIK